VCDFERLKRLIRGFDLLGAECPLKFNIIVTDYPQLLPEAKDKILKPLG